MPRWVYPRRSSAVTESELDDELVLYDGASQQVHVLNHSAAAIWRLCDGTRTPAAIARDVARHYGVSVRLVRQDVYALLERFAQSGIVDLQPAPRHEAAGSADQEAPRQGPDRPGAVHGRAPPIPA
jgi:PqqD family protein of HPr-rel-A system